MPRLWNNTIEEHRRAVREATLDAAAAVVSEMGLRSVTMARIAERAGIGRATLYKYFPDVEAIIAAWHERQIAGHLAQLTAVRDRPGAAIERLEAVLVAYAQLAQGFGPHDDRELVAAMHRDGHAMRARRHLRELLRDLIADGATEGAVRGDVPAEELAAYCLSALDAGRDLPTEEAVRRLVSVTLHGLRSV